MSIIDLSAYRFLLDGNSLGILWMQGGYLYVGKKVLEQVLIISGRKMGYGKLCYMYLNVYFICCLLFWKLLLVLSLVLESLHISLSICFIFVLNIFTFQGCACLAVHHRLPEQGQKSWGKVGFGRRHCKRALGYLWQKLLF